MSIETAIPITLSDESMTEYGTSFETTLFKCVHCGALMIPREAIENCYSCGTLLTFDRDITKDIDFNAEK